METTRAAASNRTDNLFMDGTSRKKLRKQTALTSLADHCVLRSGDILGNALKIKQVFGRGSHAVLIPAGL
jgi:hypothetical protein